MSLTPVSNLAIVSGHRTLAEQIVLRAHGLSGRKYLERFQKSGVIEQQPDNLAAAGITCPNCGEDRWNAFEPDVSTADDYFICDACGCDFE